MYKFNIILTEMCNANCSHCYMNLNSNKHKKTMSFQDIDKIVEKMPINTISVTLTGGEIFLVKELLFYTIKKIRNKNKDSDVLETTKSNYLIIEGEYGSREYSSDISFQFIKVPYDIDRELEDENLNIEKENYRFELKQGMYRDMTKINENFKKLGIDVDKI